MKINILLLCFIGAIICMAKLQFKHKKMVSKKQTTRKRMSQDKNDDEQKLYNVFKKLSQGVKDSETVQYKTIIKTNEHFSSMDDMHSLDFEKVGEVRQGYVLRYVKEEQKSNLKLITLEPVFLVLNTETLSFYQNENINSLMQSYPLADIKDQLTMFSSKDKDEETKNVQANHYMTCFKVNIGTSGQSEILCLESKQAALNWIDAIKFFYKSTLRVASVNDVKIATQGSTTVTSGSSNQFAEMRIKSQEELLQKKEQEKQELSKIIASQNENRNTFLRSAIEKYQQEINEYQSQYDAEQAQLEEQKKKTEEAEDQADCIQDRIFSDQEDAIKMQVKDGMKDIQKEQNMIQKNLIDKLESISIKTKQEEDELEAARTSYQKKQTKMIQGFGIAEVEKAYAGKVELCYDADLGQDQTKENYINGHCKKIITSKTQDILKGNTMKVLDDCMNEKNFCGFCCDYEVGVLMVQKKKDCKEKCNNALQNIFPPEIAIKLNLKNLNQQNKFRFKSQTGLKKKMLKK